MRNLFLDTNILVDLVCHREPFVQEAKRIFALAYTGRINIGICALSYVNTIYIAKKYGYKTDEIIDSLKKIASFTTITSLDESIVKKAMDSDWNDFEDSVQYNSSLSFSADYIITRNPKDFVHSTIPVYTPIEFLQIPYWMEDSETMTLNEPPMEYHTRNSED